MESDLIYKGKYVHYACKQIILLSYGFGESTCHMSTQGEMQLNGALVILHTYWSSVGCEFHTLAVMASLQQFVGNCQINCIM